MNKERQIILAGKILELNDKISQDLENKVDVNWEDYDNLRKMAAILARRVGDTCVCSLETLSVPYGPGPENDYRGCQCKKDEPAQ